MIYQNDIENTLNTEDVTVAKVIGYSAKVIYAVMNKAFSEADIQLQMETYIILRILSVKKNVIQQDLAKALQKDKSSILRIINSLQEKKWVARIPDSEDKRRNYLVLTQLGNEVLTEALLIEKKTTDRLKDNLDPNQVNQLKHILHTIRQNGYLLLNDK